MLGFHDALKPIGVLAASWDGPRDAERLVLYFHGNGEHVAHVAPVLDDLRSHLRANVLCVDYRGCRERGVFPQNRERTGRTPVFIDLEGRFCAVGHLVRMSAGEAAAYAIDARHHLD